MNNILLIDATDSIGHFIDDKGLSVSICDDEIKALGAAESLKPSIIILHYGIRENGTAEYIRLLTSVSKNSKIILIAPKLTDDEVMTLLIAGAQGYLQTDQLAQYINKAIKVIDEGEAWISRRLTALVLNRLRNNRLFPSPT